VFIYASFGVAFIYPCRTPEIPANLEHYAFAVNHFMNGVGPKQVLNIMRKYIGSLPEKRLDGPIYAPKCMFKRCRDH
jgi:hypothetical protein